MNWDEAHLLGDLEAQEERRMTDDPVKQAIAELQGIVHCNCDPDYLDRGRHSHVCLHYMAEPVEVVANRIEELEAENNMLKTSGIVEVAVRNPNVMEYMKHWEGRAEAAEAKLAKAVEALHQIAGDKDFADDPWGIARTTLAELTGKKK